jgi:hypothetical protein
LNTRTQRSFQPHFFEPFGNFLADVRVPRQPDERGCKSSRSHAIGAKHDQEFIQMNEGRCPASGRVQRQALKVEA